MGVTVLLDTHALLWAVGCPEKLSAKIRTQLEDRLSTVLVSTASAWEIATKYRIGKLDEAEEFLANYYEHLGSTRQWRCRSRHHMRSWLVALTLTTGTRSTGLLPLRPSCSDYRLPRRTQRSNSFLVERCGD